MTEGKSPQEIIASVEDWIDYPPHTISLRMAQKILQALNDAGWKVVPLRETGANGEVKQP